MPDTKDDTALIKAILEHVHEHPECAKPDGFCEADLMGERDDSLRPQYK